MPAQPAPCNCLVCSGAVMLPHEVIPLVESLSEDEAAELFLQLANIQDEEDYLIEASAWLRAYEARRNRG